MDVTEKIFLSEVGEENVKCMTKSQIKTLEDIFLAPALEGYDGDFSNWAKIAENTYCLFANDNAQAGLHGCFLAVKTETKTHYRYVDDLNDAKKRYAYHVVSRNSMALIAGKIASKMLEVA